jgi:hypothetical protein
MKREGLHLCGQLHQQLLIGTTMKILIIIYFLTGNYVMAQSYSNFSGDWIGICSVNGKEKPSEKRIEQADDGSITINGMKFDLTKPTVTTLDDEDQGKKFREITVYDWQWDENKQVINTSAKWIGWYLDAPGSWDGSGVGVIKLEDGKLIATRKFGNNDETCSLERK